MVPDNNKVNATITSITLLECQPPQTVVPPKPQQVLSSLLVLLPESCDPDEVNNVWNKCPR